MASEAWQHFNWKELMTQHITILEQHVSTLGQIHDSMRQWVDAIDDKQEMARWESGEVGNWGHVCGMIDRARHTLLSARKAAEVSGMLSDREPGDWKDLGGKSTSSVKTNGPDSAHTPNSIPEDSEMEDAPPLSNPRVTPLEGHAHIQNHVLAKMVKKRKKLEDESSKISKKMKTIDMMATAHPEQNSLGAAEPITRKIAKLKMGKKRKRSSDGLSEGVVRKVKPRTSTELIRVKDAGSTVDFEALQAKLQAEVDLGEASRDVEAQGSYGESKTTKKRRRSSDGLSKQGKKSKKDEI